VESRFERYADVMLEALGHANRATGATRFNFTKQALAGVPLPTPGKRATYHDAKTTGLQVRVTELRHEL
jgi:hypothetical protein